MLSRLAIVPLLAATLTRDPLPDHIRVFEAVEAGDGAAAHAAMTELVDMAFQDTRVTLPA